MTDSAKTLLVQIDSRLEMASLVGTCIRALCLDAGLDEMAAYQVQTCTIEAVNNAIIHAYGRKSGHSVEIRWMLGDAGLSIQVGDRGKAMAEMPPETEPDPLAESGRGWWIMRQWMDGVDYETDGTGNRVILRKLLV
ncbi:ATP-binding protein [Marichromatium purpuratum]|uniref:ATP-binding protein n=1 Tax=Marichromatium purpuratum TaxID=37487 RepID=UPI00021E7390|nr:ATP-binding protein [Marichromatium purpuratum]